MMTKHIFIEQVGRLFQQVKALTLATADPQGRPHAATLYFAPDDELDLYFISSPRAAHVRHLTQRPQVAAALHPPIHLWQQIQGIQLKGVCAPIDPNDRDRIWALYLNKFPDVAEAAALVRDSQFYRLRPNWVRWIDNRVRFGYRLESAWPPPNELGEKRSGAIG